MDIEAERKYLAKAIEDELAVTGNSVTRLTSALERFIRAVKSTRPAKKRKVQ